MRCDATRRDFAPVAIFYFVLRRGARVGGGEQLEEFRFWHSDRI